MEVRLAESDNELAQILALQQENHYQNISPEKKSAEGFVTVRHDLDTLLAFNKKACQVIATDGNQVIGYALVMLEEFRNLTPVLMPMFELFDKLEYRGIRLSDYNYYVMGQVCIAENYRGKGLFQQLYEKHKSVYSSQFDLCLTEVSTSNPRSMAAHEKVGFETIHQFKDDKDEWNVLSWDWS